MASKAQYIIGVDTGECSAGVHADNVLRFQCHAVFLLYYMNGPDDRG